MMTLIIGGSKSGKSAYAEDYIGAVSEGKTKYYIATMQSLDSETRKKIERHKRLRGGKGFLTIEQPLLIQSALEKMLPGEKTALLECISNLAANEMFLTKKPKNAAAAAKSVIEGVFMLKAELSKLVVISNNVFEDGANYDDMTIEYIRAMGSINKCLADMADMVIEVVAGIPIIIKE